MEKPIDGKSCLGCFGLLFGLGMLIGVMALFTTPSLTATQVASATGTAMYLARARSAILPIETPDLPSDYKAHLQPKLIRMQTAIAKLDIANAQTVADDIAYIENEIFSMAPPPEVQAIHTKISDAIYSCASGAEALEWYTHFERSEDLRKMERELTKCTAALDQIIAWIAPDVEAVLLPTVTPTPRR